MERELAATVDEARRFIMAGRLFAGTQKIDKASDLLDPECDLTVRAAARFVSRGGEKLAAALEAFGTDPADRVCLDAGCSTGGFTDCLLQRGARKVFAVDVGYGDLAWTLRNDERVVLLERTNVRRLDPSAFGDDRDSRAIDLVVADLAFISLRTVMPTLANLAGPGAELVLLVKPQFELPRQDVEDGVVRDPRLHERAVESVLAESVRIGLDRGGVFPSPLLGPQGNREVFVRLTKRSGAM